MKTASRRLFLLGLRLLTTGKVLPGAVLMAGAILWAAWRALRRQAAHAGGGRAPLLGVSRTREPRRNPRRAPPPDRPRPPDAGGSAELANRVNVARDTLSPK
jgi:DnaJ family protein C protein 19